jgi:hypothetical protein
MIEWKVQSSILFIHVKSDLLGVDADRLRAAWFERPLDRSVSEVSIWMNEVRIVDYQMMQMIGNWLARTSLNVPRISMKGIHKPIYEIMQICQFQQWCQLSR